MRDIKQVPDNIRQAVINNGGGHANHSMFWVIMGPKAGGKPTGPIGDDINKVFGDFATFQGQLKQAGLGRFGSGWAWLVLADGKLQIVNTANQDNPLMNGQVPILGVDGTCLCLRYPEQPAPDYVNPGGRWPTGTHRPAFRSRIFGEVNSRARPCRARVASPRAIRIMYTSAWLITYCSSATRARRGAMRKSTCPKMRGCSAGRWRSS